MYLLKLVISLSLSKQIMNQITRNIFIEKEIVISFLRYKFCSN